MQRHDTRRRYWTNDGRRRSQCWVGLTTQMSDIFILPPYPSQVASDERQYFPSFPSTGNSSDWNQEMLLKCHWRYLCCYSCCWCCSCCCCCPVAVSSAGWLHIQATENRCWCRIFMLLVAHFSPFLSPMSPVSSSLIHLGGNHHAN